MGARSCMVSLVPSLAHRWRLGGLSHPVQQLFGYSQCMHRLQPNGPCMIQPHGYCKNNTFPFSFLPENKALGHPALQNSVNR